MADLEGILRLIQSIPSKKAEPVMTWSVNWGALSSLQSEPLTTSGR
ncbi:MAG: hypothetical protein IJU33_09940 [Bacteroidales bacterium]|nr:hypothetical protein [Bacteroidales bacterium]